MRPQVPADVVVAAPIVRSKECPGRARASTCTKRPPRFIKTRAERISTDPRARSLLWPINAGKANVHHVFVDCLDEGPASC
jgi:hypothetical protein